MDFLQQSVLPQSAHHIVLLKYMLVLAYFIFLPYFALLLGSMFISDSYRKKYNDKNLSSYKVVDFLTFNRIAPIAFGFVPFLSIVFIYMQIFQFEGLNFVIPFFFSFIFLIFGTILLYFYKHYYSLHLLIKNESEQLQESEKFLSLLKSLNNFERYGKYSKLFLILGMITFFASANYAINSIQPDISFIVSLISIKTIVHFIEFVVLSFLLSYILFGYNLVKSGEGSNYEILASLTKRILVFSLSIPLLILLETVTSEKNSLSENYFIYVLINIFTIILISNTAYKSIKSGEPLKFNSVLFMIIIFVASFIIKDQYLFNTQSQLAVNKLIDNYTLYENKVKAEFGVVVVKVSGADIFNGKCIACHNFDKKVVGPAYKDVLPKYEGKMPDLVKFILNPVKVNPDFPSMPNQGLKPNEAEAIADYIMQTYTQQYKK
ncbi:MAG: hypothetical protein Fur0015_15360 [Ignavibacteriales bacterium]